MRYLLLCLVSLLILGSATSCQKDAASGTRVHTERLAIEKKVSKVFDADSLEAQLRIYQEQNKPLEQIITYRYLGNAYRRRNLNGKAIDFHQHGLRIALEESDTLEVLQAYNNIGTDYRGLSFLDQAAEQYYRSLSIADTYSNPKDSIAQKAQSVSLNGLGNIHLLLNNLHLADSAFRKAYDIEVALNSHIGRAINLAGIGHIWEKKGRIDSAEHYFKASMHENQLENSIEGISISYRNLGKVAELRHDWQKAISLYKKAFSLMGDDARKPHGLSAAVSLGRVYIQLGNYPEAHNILSQCYQAAEELKSLHTRAAVQHLYFELYRSEGKFAEAVRAKIEATSWEDSIERSDNVAGVQDSRIDFIRSQTALNMERYRQEMGKEIRFRNRLTWTMCVILLIAIAAIALLIYALVQKRKSEEMQVKLADERTNFFTNITHEFRTPLTIILGYARQLSLQSVPNGETWHSLGSYIEHQGQLLLSLVNQLLEISKVRSSVAKPDWKRGDVAGFVRMQVDSFRYAASAKHINLEVLIDHHHPTEAPFVPGYLQKIVENLVSNAVKYTPTGGRVSVSFDLQKTGEYTLEVSDNGLGIPADEVDKIFQPFYIGTTTDHSLGVGIGLSLVHQLVETLKGTITVESEVGKGATFIVHQPAPSLLTNLPFFSPDQSWAVEPSIPVAAPVAPPVKQGQDEEDTPLLLIVDDNADISHYMANILGSQYRTIYARNGSEGLEKAKEHVPDLIISDLMMPEMDGYDFCKSVRADRIINHIPIVVVSAKVSVEYRVQALQAGANVFLTKPFFDDELRVLVERTLTERRKMHDNFARQQSSPFAVPSATTDTPNAESSIAPQNEAQPEVAATEALSEQANDAHVGTDDKTDANGFPSPLVDLPPPNVDRQFNEVEIEFLEKLDKATIARLRNSEVDIERLASDMCMSYSQLRRKILAVTGEKASAYVMRIRLNTARQLMYEHPEMPINEVASRCGFYDNAHLTRQFKQTFGITPSKFRRDPYGLEKQE